MRIISMIPARLQASRFPRKLLEDLGGLPVIGRTFEAVRVTGLFDQVVVVTDSDEIEEVIRELGGAVYRSQAEHPTGSDRMAEAAESFDADLIVNVQGDEPFINTENLKSLIEVFRKDLTERIDLASLRTPVEDPAEINNPNVVKVICDTEGRALYFSRAPIPYPRDEGAAKTYYRHLGVYAFRRQALLDFRKLEIGPLEAAEKIEAIRFLEYGKSIQMIDTLSSGVGIDSPEDLEKARALWNKTIQESK
jgi:3-deoxy-manno-octulosonate cytidylyltransferase (CMP-KDO synthetase)